MATPLTAGAIERIRQYFVQGYYPLGAKGTGSAFVPDEALVRAVILASCQPMSGTGDEIGCWWWLSHCCLILFSCNVVLYIIFLLL